MKSLQVAVALGIPKTDSCYRLIRVRNVKESPLVYTITYLKCVAELPLDEKYYMESLYKFLKDTYQIVIEKGEDTLEAALPSETFSTSTATFFPSPKFTSIWKV